MLIALFLFLLVIYVIGLFLWAHLLASGKRTGSMLIWTFWLLLFPLFGIPLYLLLGTDRIRRKRMEMRGRYLNPAKQTEKKASEDSNFALLRYVGGLTNNALTSLAQPKILPDTENYYTALIEEIDKAEEYIHFQTYVWRPDDVGARFRDALTRAAKRGVKVRLLVDELGSPDTKEEFFKPLIDAGGEFSWCLTVHPRRNRYFFNLRNHRKIQIIDSRIAFVGGMNIGKEYEGRDESVGPWRDMQMSLTGPAMNELQITFLSDWEFATGAQIDVEEYFCKTEPTEQVPAAIIRSGPDNYDQVFLMSFIFFCNHAQKSLDLFTPYFAPDDPMLLAIAMAAERGVRVRMIIPTLNEHQYMVDLGRAYYETLLRAGVEIYEMPGAVNHAKVYLADEEWVMIGSPNLDMRSIRLNFEVGMMFPHRPTAEALTMHYESFFENSERVTEETFRQFSFKDRVRLGFVRLFSPVL